MSDTDHISVEEFAALRARLVAKQYEFIGALHTLSRRGMTDGRVVDALFGLLGCVTFWLTLDAPTRTRAEEVGHTLDSYIVDTGPDALEKLKARYT